MFSLTDTIVAIATPSGRGGIGVVRVSGPEAAPIAQRLITHRGVLEPRYATRTKVRLTASDRGDDRPPMPIRNAFATDAFDHVVAIYFPAPASYTGDDVVELSAHGSPVVLHAIVTAAVAYGARLAEPGEFTLRAFLNGRIDLMQAEAVADLIDAATPLQARAAFDQLDGTLTRAIAAVDATLFDLIARLEASLTPLLVTRDPLYDRNAVTELRAGTGGDEAARGKVGGMPRTAFPTGAGDEGRHGAKPSLGRTGR